MPLKILHIVCYFVCIVRIQAGPGSIQSGSEIAGESPGGPGRHEIQPSGRCAEEHVGRPCAPGDPRGGTVPLIPTARGVEPSVAECRASVCDAGSAFRRRGVASVMWLSRWIRQLPITIRGHVPTVITPGAVTTPAQHWPGI